MEISHMRCPKCGTELRGNPDHCPICHYVFSENYAFFPIYLDLFLISIVVYSLIQMFGSNSLLGFHSIIFHFLPDIISLLILFSGTFFLRKFYVKGTGMPDIEFSSESLAALLSMIFVSVNLILVLLLYHILYVGRSALINNMLDISILSESISYTSYIFSLLMLVSLYGIVKLSRMRGNRISYFSGIFLFLGWFLFRLPVVVSSPGFSTDLFLNYRSLYLLMNDSSLAGLILIMIFSIILIIFAGNMS